MHCLSKKLNSIGSDIPVIILNTCSTDEHFRLTNNSFFQFLFKYLHKVTDNHCIQVSVLFHLVFQFSCHVLYATEQYRKFYIMKDSYIINCVKLSKLLHNLCNTFIGLAAFLHIKKTFSDIMVFPFISYSMEILFLLKHIAWNLAGLAFIKLSLNHMLMLPAKHVLKYI